MENLENLKKLITDPHFEGNSKEIANQRGYVEGVQSTLNLLKDDLIALRNNVKEQILERAVSNDFDMEYESWLFEIGKYDKSIFTETFDEDELSNLQWDLSTYLTYRDLINEFKK